MLPKMSFRAGDDQPSWCSILTILFSIDDLALNAQLTWLWTHPLPQLLLVWSSNLPAFPFQWLDLAIFHGFHWPPQIHIQLTAFSQFPCEPFLGLSQFCTAPGLQWAQYQDICHSIQECWICARLMNKSGKYSVWNVQGWWTKVAHILFEMCKVKWKWQISILSLPLTFTFCVIWHTCSLLNTSNLVRKGKLFQLWAHETIFKRFWLFHPEFAMWE